MLYKKGKRRSVFAASEKQAIDAALISLSQEDKDFWDTADHYWNARGGSYTDGGAFIFEVKQNTLTCRNKFNELVYIEELKPYITAEDTSIKIDKKPFKEFFLLKEQLKKGDYKEGLALLQGLEGLAFEEHLKILTSLLDDSYPLEQMRQSCLKSLIKAELTKLLLSIKEQKTGNYSYLAKGEDIPLQNNEKLILNAENYAVEGENSLALKIVDLYQKGVKHFILFNCQGQRFLGSGFGQETKDLRLEIYGSTGDYLASGIDGTTIIVHNNAQDQVAQIMNQGTLVIQGDVGQAFMYGAKGG